MHPTQLLDYTAAFRALAHLADPGVLLLTPDRRVEFMSERARRLLHCRPEDDPAACWARARGLVASALDRADAEPTRPTRETVRLRRESNDRQLHLEAYALGDTTPTDVGYLVLVEDYDTLQRVEQSLHLALQMQQTSRLYEGLAHDLRQPIGAILIHLKVLEELNSRTARDAAGSADFRESIAVIRDEVQELDRSLRLLLRELSPSDVEEPINLQEVMQSVARLIAPQVRKEGLAFRTEIADAPLTVLGRRFRIKQAVLNLATNAIEAMHQGTLTLRLRAHGDQACIEVADEGPGIPEEVQARMFERRYTTKEEGTGLGLDIVRQTAELHGGRINVRSAPGEGTTVELFLPLHASEPVGDA